MTTMASHQPRGCLLNRLFRRRWKKTSKLRVTCLCAGNSPGPVNSPHKGPVMRKMFPFDDVIMRYDFLQVQLAISSTLVFSYGKQLCNRGFLSICQYVSMSVRRPVCLSCISACLHITAFKPCSYYRIVAKLTQNIHYFEFLWHVRFQVRKSIKMSNN